MSRPPRIDHPGARHHVTNRGARKAPILQDPWARKYFMALLARLPARFNVRIHAYAIMTNHYHLVIESLDGRLAKAIQVLDGQFASAVNKRGNWDGPIWKGRYFNTVVESERHWRHLLAYVHLNPHKAGLTLQMSEPLWTSHSAYLDPHEKPDWLTVADMIRSFGTIEAYDRYLEDCLHGHMEAPDGFERAILRSAPETGRFEDLPVTESRLQTINDALAQVVVVTGMSAETLKMPWGPRHERDAKRIMTWWLATTTDASVRTIGAALGCGSAAISKRILALERNLHDPAVARVIAQLEDSRQGRRS